MEKVFSRSKQKEDERWMDRCLINCPSLWSLHQLTAVWIIDVWINTRNKNWAWVLLAIGLHSIYQCSVSADHNHHPPPCSPSSKWEGKKKKKKTNQLYDGSVKAYWVRLNALINRSDFYYYIICFISFCLMWGQKRKEIRDESGSFTARQNRWLHSLPFYSDALQHRQLFIYF